MKNWKPIVCITSCKTIEYTLPNTIPHDSFYILHSTFYIHKRCCSRISTTSKTMRTEDLNRNIIISLPHSILRIESALHLHARAPLHTYTSTRPDEVPKKVCGGNLWKDTRENGGHYSLALKPPFLPFATPLAALCGAQRSRKEPPSLPQNSTRLSTTKRLHLQQVTQCWQETTPLAQCLPRASICIVAEGNRRQKP